MQRVRGPAALSGFCVKCFTRATDASTWAKLNYQIRHAPNQTETKRFRLAWPEQILTSHARPIGFLMRAAHEPHLELSALARQHVDKDKDVKFRKFDLSARGGLLARVRLCTNICAAMNMLFTGGEYNLLDFKPENVLVTADGRVTLVDLDSVQIRDRGQIIYPGLAGTEGYKPPEGASINPPDSAKDKHWDAFSLAVVLYQVLVGAPPFAGTFHPPYDKYHEMDERVRAGLFVYGDREKHLKLRPKQHDTFTALSPELQMLFKRALSLGDRAKRPNVSDWGAALARFSGAGSTAANFRPVAPPKAKPKGGSRPSPAAFWPPPGMAAPAPNAAGGGSTASPNIPFGRIIGLTIGGLFVVGMLSELVSCASSIINPSSPSVRTTSPPVPVPPSSDYSQPEEAAEPPPRYSIRPFPASIPYLIDSPDSGVWIQLGPGRDYASGPLLRHGDEVTGHGSTIGEDGVTWISITGPDGTSGFIMERLLRAAAVGGSQSAGPSFACSGTLSWDERAICEDADLAAKDRQMVSAYRDLLASLSGPNRQNLMNDQAKWLRERRDCPDSLCLSVSYYSRIRALQSWSSNVPIDEPADARRPSGPRPNSLPQQPVRDVDQAGDERARVRAERARARADRAKNRAQGAGNREGYVAPAEGPICILPSGQEARVGEQRCRELSGVIYQ